MLAGAAEVVKGDQVVIFVIPGQCPGTDYETISAVKDVLGFVGLPVEILEPDLPVMGNGVVDLVDAVINAFVHGLDAALNVYLALKLTGLGFAYKFLDLFYQLARLSLRYEF